MEPTQGSIAPDWRTWRRPTILHIEDDPTLAFLVTAAFEDFGFLGSLVLAKTVEEASALLDSSNRHGKPIDMILCDMNLPDGSGFDIIKRVKASPAFSRTPILVLSSELTPDKINRAYALGVNCYVPKSRADKSFNEVIRSLYAHWIQDVALPSPLPPDRLRRILNAQVAALGRRADCHMRVAKLFKNDPDEMRLWLSLSLGESNTANLVSFVAGQVSEDDVPSEIMDGLKMDYDEVLPFIDAAEKRLVRLDSKRLPSRDDVYRFMVPLLSHCHAEHLANAVSYGFPNFPVVMQAILGTIYENYSRFADWVETHTEDQDLRHQATLIKQQLKKLKVLTVDSVAPR